MWNKCQDMLDTTSLDPFNPTCDEFCKRKLAEALMSNYQLTLKNQQLIRKSHRSKNDESRLLHRQLYWDKCSPFRSLCLCTPELRETDWEKAKSILGSNPGWATDSLCDLKCKSIDFLASQLTQQGNWVFKKPKVSLKIELSRAELFWTKYKNNCWLPVAAFLSWNLVKYKCIPFRKS